MPNLPKRITQLLFVLILLLVPLTLLVKEVKAVTYDQPNIDSLNSDIQKIQSDNKTIVDTGINSRQQILSIYNGARLLGCVNTDPKICDPNTTGLGFLANMMGTMYSNPPASFALYLQDTLAKAGLVKPAYAQGVGFLALNPLLNLWKASRNISYSVLVIVMVAIGFMIIFRMKIDPKTVISVQAALPKIIVTLLLITFSYAIAGFLIDLMYLIMAAAISIMANSVPIFQGSGTEKALQEEFLTGRLGQLFGNVFGYGMLSVVPLAANILELPLVVAPIVGAGLAIIAGTLTVPALVIGVAVPILFVFIIFLGLLFTFIRLVLLLLNSYIQLLVGVILGPILLLQEAIPGRSAFSGWLLNLMANLSVFPTTAIILLFSRILILENLLPAALPGSGWAPPFLGFATLNEKAFPAFLGLGVIFLAPNLVVSVKKIFQPKPTLPVTAGTMLSPLTGAASTGLGAMQSFYYVQQPFTHGAGKGILDRVTNVFKGNK